MRATGQAEAAGSDPFVGRLATVLKAKGGSWAAAAEAWRQEVSAPGILPSWGPRGGPSSAKAWSQRLQAVETTLRELGWTIDRDVVVGRGDAKRQGIAITAPAAALDDVADVDAL
jgi:hypothetical protein